MLDIGCGNKPYEKLFNKYSTEYVGCDIIQSSLEKVDIVCDALDIPVENDSFQTVFSTQVIEHVGDHNKLIQEANRVLEKGGHFIVSGPMYWHLHEDPHDYFRFTKHGFKFILERGGFEVVETLANGGKWATLGQMIIHTFPSFIIKYARVRQLINVIFDKLDNKYYNDYNTMNYVIVAKKV